MPKELFKRYKKVTLIGDNIYLKYHRNNDGTFNISNHVVDNQDVVSYNLILKKNI